MWIGRVGRKGEDPGNDEVPDRSSFLLNSSQVSFLFLIFVKTRWTLVYLSCQDGTWKYLKRRMVVSSLVYPFFAFFLATPLTANAGFWQYGTLRWDDFYRYLTSFIFTNNTDWRVFQYDLTRQQHGGLCQSDNQIVQPGQYVLLSTCK